MGSPLEGNNIYRYTDAVRLFILSEEITFDPFTGFTSDCVFAGGWLGFSNNCFMPKITAV